MSCFGRAVSGAFEARVWWTGPSRNFRFRCSVARLSFCASSNFANKKHSKLGIFVHAVLFNEFMWTTKAQALNGMRCLLRFPKSSGPSLSWHLGCFGHVQYTETFATNELNSRQYTHGKLVLNYLGSSDIIGCHHHKLQLTPDFDCFVSNDV